MSLTDLSAVLWRTRELMELLLFKLEEEQVLLASGRSRWLAHATREVELVLEQMRGTELIRATRAQAAAVALGLRPDAVLSEIADAGVMPWPDLLREHHRSFLMLNAEIRDFAGANLDLLEAGAAAGPRADPSAGPDSRNGEFGSGEFGSGEFGSTGLSNVEVRNVGNGAGSALRVQVPPAVHRAVLVSTPRTIQPSLISFIS